VQGEELEQQEQASLEVSGGVCPFFFVCAISAATISKSLPPYAIREVPHKLSLKTTRLCSIFAASQCLTLCFDAACLIWNLLLQRR
jgi:hypothetical protein